MPLAAIMLTEVEKMKNDKIKFSWKEWHKVVENAVVVTLILGAAALCYGYYLLDRISGDDTQVQSVSVSTNTPVEAEVLPQEEENIGCAVKEDSHEPQKTDEIVSEPEVEETAETAPVMTGSLAVVSYKTVASGSDAEKPCALVPKYEYGYGYDPLYKDIRFHDHALYQAEESFPVYADSDGVVEEIIVNDKTKALTLRHEWGYSEYEGLTECAADIGTKLSKGDYVGTACELRYRVWEKE